MLDEELVLPLVDSALGRWSLVRAEEEWLTRARVDHEPTARFLRTVGIPVQSQLLSEFHALRRPPETYRSMAREYGWQVGEQTLERRGALVRIGIGLNDETLFLDPAAGAVYDMYVDEGSGMYNSSVSHLVYFAAYWEAHSRIDGVWLADMDFDGPDCDAAAGEQAILSHFAEIDPAAFEPPGKSIWADVDGFADGYYSEWAWERGALEYFIEQGIDPTVLEPRRPMAGH